MVAFITSSVGRMCIDGPVLEKEIDDYFMGQRPYVAHEIHEMDEFVVYYCMRKKWNVCWHKLDGFQLPWDEKAWLLHYRQHDAAYEQ